MSPVTLAAAAVAAQFVLANSSLAQVVTSPAQARATLEQSCPGLGLSEHAGRITRVYGVPFSTGRSPVESARAFVAAHAGTFGVRPEHLISFGPFPDGRHVQPVMWEPETESYKFTLVAYTQQVEGIPVFRSALKLLVRNDAGYPLVLASADLHDLGAFAGTLAGKAVSPSRLDAAVYAREVLRQFRQRPVIQDPHMVIWAGVDEMVVEPKLAVTFIIESGTPGVDPQKMLYVCDSNTGEILFEEDQICYADVTGTTEGVATAGWVADACGAEIATPLPYVLVTAGSTSVYSNAQGQFTIPNAGTGAVDVAASVDGLYFVNTTQQGTDESLATSIPSGGNGTLLFNAANGTTLDDQYRRAAVNAYRHANMARDFTLTYNPDYPTVATQTAFQINTNLASTCNAYYNGSSINFYSAGGGCNNTAFATVVHHEYGHHLVSTGGSGQGAYGEAVGDVVGLLISDVSTLAIGFQSCAGGLREANNDCQYSATGCSSCGSEIHACGQLYSGCVWDTRQYLIGAGYSNYISMLSNWAINSILLHSGSTINGDITIDWLTLDDDNGNLNDGGPHYSLINNGFTAHGLPGPAISPLAFTFPGGLPTMVSPSGTTSIAMNVSALAAIPISGTGTFYWRNGTTGAFNSVPMSQGAPNSYTVSVPATACLSTVQYYFSARNTLGATVYFPLNAPTGFQVASSATGNAVLVDDNCETATAWVVGDTGDTATAGVWVRVDPNGTSAQPENDHSDPGSMCWATGQGSAGGAAGAQDVDGGVTSLTSPGFAVTNPAGTYITFWLWYSNDQGGSPASDVFPILISGDNGSTWANLETIGTGGSTNAWVQKSYRVSDYVTPTGPVKIKFQAQDLNNGSLIEAAIDDLRVTGIECSVPSVPGDLNGDSHVDGADLALLLSGWGTSAGDVDGNGTTDGADLTILSANWG